MLSISPPMRGSGPGDYYLELAREDYYVNGGEPPGKWFGQGAQTLGLSGTVDKESFRNLLSGFAPAGHRRLVANAGHPDRQCGWDLTFSAPKTVSVAWSQAPETIRRQFQAAQQAAVEKALHYLEDVAALTRRGKAGVETEEARFLAATFEHGTSRAQDPQLHTHALVINLSFRQDGSTGTLRSLDLFRHKMAAGALYRAELAHQIASRLALMAVPVKTWFELKGVSQKLAQEFSKRRAEIVAVLAERGHGNAVAAKVAALDTRQKKGHVARRDLVHSWQETGRRFGWSAPQLHRLANPANTPAAEESLKAAAREITTAAISQITTRQSYFSVCELVRRAAELCPGSGIGSDQLLAAIEEEAASPHLVEIGLIREQRIFTTPAVLAEERALLDLVGQSTRHTGHVIPLPKVSKAIAAHPQLSAEQQRAVRHITVEAGTIKVVSGLPGTGKTVTLAVARQVWEQQGYTVLGAALSGKAAQGLQEGSGIRSATVHKTLRDLGKSFIGLEVWHKPLAPGAPAWSPISRIQLPYLKLRLGGGKVALDAKTVLVVDEAAMIGTRLMHDLLRRAEQAGAKVVLVGDADQLQPIEAGAPFPAIAAKVGQAKLTEIKRQYDGWARDMVRKFSDGQTREALLDLAARGNVIVATTAQESERRLIFQWKRVGIKAPDRSLILAARNETVSRLNRLAQAQRRQARMLGRHQVTVGQNTIYEGDRVLFTRNARNLGVTNGTLGTVTGVSKHCLEVALDNGKTAVIPLQSYQDIHLGYAVTTHKAQGMTCERAFVLLEPDSQNRQITYVQVSRSREAPRIFTDETTAGPELAGLAQRIHRDGRKLLAHDLLVRQHEPPAPEPGESPEPRQVLRQMP